MAFFQFNNIRLLGTTACVPKHIVTSDSFKPQFGDEEVEKFKSMTGVVQSHRTSEHQTASDLGVAAAKRLFAHLGIDGQDIGALVFASHSPDYRRPATACIIQHRLGISKEAAAIDVSLGCSAFVYGLQVASSLLNSSDARLALLITGDTAGKSVNYADRSSAMLFGEAGAAVIIEKTDAPVAPIRGLLRTDGSGWKYMIIPGGGYRNLHTSDEEYMCQDGNPRSLNNSFIQGTSVFTFTIFDVPRLLRDFWSRTGTTPDDYDVFAFHQANLYILRQIAKKTHIPLDKMPLTLDRYGNTSGASAIVSLCDAYGPQAGSQVLRVLACGFGIGLSWGVTSFDIDQANVLPITEDDTIFEEGVITDPNQLYSAF